MSRRLPDTLVIDIVERKPAALWQDASKLSLIDAEGVVLDRVPISAHAGLAIADRPRRQRPAAAHLRALLKNAPSLRPQLESASWIGRQSLGPQFPDR